MWRGSQPRVPSSDEMRYLLILAAAACLMNFSWARRHFFVRSAATPPFRRGLAPMGTLFGVGQIISLALEAGLSLGVQTGTALVLYLGAQVTFWLTVRAFGSLRPMIAFAPAQPQVLVTKGPYKYVRHPFYTSYSLFWIAGAVAVPNWVTLTSVLVMCALYYWAALGEEASIARSALSADYATYRQETGMFLPKMPRYRQRDLD